MGHAKSEEHGEVQEKLKIAPSANDEAQDAAVMAKAAMKTACKEAGSAECTAAQRKYEELDSKAKASAANLAELTSTKSSLDSKISDLEKSLTDERKSLQEKQTAAAAATEKADSLERLVAQAEKEKVAADATAARSKAAHQSAQVAHAQAS